MWRDLLKGEIDLSSFLRRREKLLKQHYLSFGLEFGQAFPTLGLGQAGSPYSTGFGTRLMYGAAGSAVCFPGQKHAALLRVLQQVALLYRCLVTILGDALRT